MRNFNGKKVTVIGLGISNTPLIPWLLSRGATVTARDKKEFDNLPGGFTPPAERTKPYGTVHAVLAAKDVIHEPFAVIMHV